MCRKILLAILVANGMVFMVCYQTILKNKGHRMNVVRSSMVYRCLKDFGMAYIPQCAIIQTLLHAKETIKVDIIFLELKQIMNYYAIALVRKWRRLKYCFVRVRFSDSMFEY